MANTINNFPCKLQRIYTICPCPSLLKPVLSCTDTKNKNEKKTAFETRHCSFCSSTTLERKETIKQCCQIFLQGSWWKQSVVSKVLDGLLDHRCEMKASLILQPGLTFLQTPVWFFLQHFRLSMLKVGKKKCRFQSIWFRFRLQTASTLETKLLSVGSMYTAGCK